MKIINKDKAFTPLLSCFVGQCSAISGTRITVSFSFNIMDGKVFLYIHFYKVTIGGKIPYLR